MILLAGLMFTFAIPVLAADTGIVPCGLDSTYSNRCTLCHFIAGFQRIFEKAKNIIAIICLTCATFAGVMYVVSSGNESMINSAKAFLRASLIGLVIVLGAWIIVNTVITVLMPTQSDLGTGKTSWYSFGSLNCN